MSINKILYIDICGGLAGDMLVGALIDLGWKPEKLIKLINLMGFNQTKVFVKQMKHMGITSYKIVVKNNKDERYRYLTDIIKILKLLPNTIGNQAIKVFKRLAIAEAKTHGVSINKVHFHEVGAIDSIIDIVAFCAGITWLKVDKIISSALPLGKGYIKCSHGKIPLPTPTVLTLLEGAPIKGVTTENETITPTGAALISTFAEFGELPTMRLLGSGIGGGSISLDYAPNIVRLILGEIANTEAEIDEVNELTCHLDDIIPEDIPLIFERLLKEGALDVSASQIIMKKGRLGFRLTVLCLPNLTEEIASHIFNQTTTLGLRLYKTQRLLLPREVININSPWGLVRVKKTLGKNRWNFHPEAEDIGDICRKSGLPPYEVRNRLFKIYINNFKK